MEISQEFEVIVPARIVHNKIISNINIFLKNNIKVTIIANRNNLKEKYDNLEVKIIKENNISQKRNVGIENSTAVYLIFIDTDIVPNEKYLEALNLNFKKNYDFLSGPNIHTHNESIINNLIANSYKCFSIQGYKNFHKKKFKEEIVIEDAHSCNFIVKRKILIDNNIKFNEKYFTGEDHDFCKRLRNINVKINFVGDLWVHHKTKSLKNFIFERIFYGISFFTLIKNKLYRKPFLVILLIFYFVLNFIFIFFVFHYDLNKFYILFILLPFMLDALINVGFKTFLIQGIFNIFFSFAPLIGVLFGKFIDNSNFKNDSDIEK